MAEYLVRAAALEGFDDVVRDLGEDPAKLRRQVNLPADVADPDSWISYRAFLQLLELAALRTGCDHFGLLLSRHQDISMLGSVGFIMRQAPDVRTALVELRRYFAHHNQGGEIVIRVEEGYAMLGYEGKLANVGMRQQADLAVGIGKNLLQLLCGPGWRPKAVYLLHARPADPSPYEKLLQCPVHFDCESGMMAFDAADLDRPIDRADPQLHRILAEHLSLVKTSYPDDFSSQVRHLIRQALLTGDCSIERVADYLSVNKRTLQRQLRAVGVSYKNLLEEVRFDMATRYLVESSSSLTVLADMLCYSELSAFSNAFKNHFGISPRDWKKQHAMAA